MEFKELYSFTVDEEVEVEKKTTKKDKKTGEETTITKKVKEKVPVVVKIKRPSRRQLEEAELEYSVEMSRCVKKGILTKAMLAKKYSDAGGLMAERDAQKLSTAYADLSKLQTDYTRLVTKTGEKNSQDEEKSNKIIANICWMDNESLNIKKKYLFRRIKNTYFEWMISMTFLM